MQIEPLPNPNDRSAANGSYKNGAAPLNPQPSLNQSFSKQALIPSNASFSSNPNGSFVKAAKVMPV